MPPPSWEFPYLRQGLFFNSAHPPQIVNNSPQIVNNPPQYVNNPPQIVNKNYILAQDAHTRLGKQLRSIKLCWFQLHCLCSSCCDTVALGAASRPAVSNGHKKSSCMGYQNRRKLVNTDEQLFSFSKVALSFKYHRTSSSKFSVPQKYGRLMFASSC